MASGWRTGDLRGDEGRPRTVSAVVRHAWLGLGAARVGEASMLGLTGVCVLLAAAAHSGVSLGRVDVWVAVTFGGSLCALSWWLEHRVTQVDVARTLDRRLRHQGALFTAFELERASDRGPVGALLFRQVLSRLRRREALRAVRPSMALPVVAPLLGAAALAATLEVVREVPEDHSSSGVTSGLVSRIGAIQGEALGDPVTTRDQINQIQAALKAARALDLNFERLRAADPEAALAAVEELDRRLADLVGPGADPVGLLEARSWLDSLRQVLRREGAGPGSGEMGDRGAAGGAGEAGGVTGQPSDGTMSGSTSLDDGGADSPDEGRRDATPEPGDAPTETGSSAGAWWPAEYDEVVRRWLWWAEREAER